MSEKIEDIAAIRSDVEKMQSKKAPKAHIDAYIKNHTVFTSYKDFLRGAKRFDETGGKTVDAGFGRLLLQGLTLGFADEIEAYAKSLKGADYRNTLASIRYGIKDYREKNPGVTGSAFVAEAAGAALPTVAAMIAAPFTGGSSSAAIAPSLLRLFGRGVTTGGATGAFSGFGAGEGGIENRLDAAERGLKWGAGTGGVIPLAGRTARTGYRAVRPWISSKAQREVVGDALNQVATNPAAAAQSLRNAPEIVPGSYPTTAQAARDPGMAAFQTPVRSAYDVENRIAQRLSEQNAARQKVLGRISGETPETISYATAKRKAVTDPMREEAFDATTINQKMIPPGYTLTVTKLVEDLLETPAGKRKTVSAALKSVIPQIKKADNVRDLYEIRKDLRLASLGKLSGPKSDFKLARKELEKVIREVDNVIESAAPGYQAYMNRFSKMSRPIDQMTVLQNLRNKSAHPGPDVLTGEPVLSQAKMRSQMQRPEITPPRGEPPLLAPSQTRQVKQVMSDLDRSVAPTAPYIKVPGSDTARNLTVANVLGRILDNQDSSLGRNLASEFSFLYGMPERQVRKLIVDAMLDPKLASNLMSEASESSMKRLSVALRNKMRLTGAAATAGTLSGLLSNQ